MKVNNIVRQIFSHAVAMDQSGGMRNTVYAIGKEIFILSYDHSTLLKFGVRRSEVDFDPPISFRANDYDSDHFYEEEGKIIFEFEDKGFQRKKSCGVPGMSPQEVQQLFQSFSVENVEGESIELSKDVLAMLESNLSHIEFMGEAGDSLKLIQRNIYSGVVIEIKESNEGFFKEKLKNDFGPIALKTGDFYALYSFQDVLKFTFPEGHDDFILIRSSHPERFDMVGILACCIYDEIIEIKEARDGRKEPKIRRSK